MQIAKQINLILILNQSNVIHTIYEPQTKLYCIPQDRHYHKKINKIFVTIQHISTITDLLRICSTHN